MAKKNTKNSSKQTLDDGDPLFILIELESASKEAGVPPKKTEGLFKKAFDLIRENATKEVIVAVIKELIEFLKQQF